MTTEPYLVRLTVQLTEGLARLPADFRDRHASYIRSCQNPDGGFSAREGGSDLYYTGFALRGLAVLDALTSDDCERAARFLRDSMTGRTGIVDFFSFLYSCFLVQLAGGPDVLAASPTDWPDRVAQTLESFRKADGGYAKSADSASGSTYHTFLVALCYELLGKNVPQPEDVVRFLRSRRREDGGFVEIAPMRRSGTNPTAAAIGALDILCHGTASAATLLQEVRDGVVDFLAEMPSEEGGLRANGRIPLADLLSTFTGTWTLQTLDAMTQIDRGDALAYAQSLEQAGGGFRGGLWDDGTDVEYTFYGLGCVALLR